MDMKPVNLLVHEGIDELEKLLGNETGIELQTTLGKTDEEIRQLLLETDFFVSPEFKPAWHSHQNARLRVVHSTGAGTDAIDRASTGDCVVCNVYGHERGVTEQVFMFMLALQKKLFTLDAALRQGDWSPRWPLLDELRNRRVLLLGFGHIGVEVARIAGVFDMTVTALTRSPAPERTRGLSLGHCGALSELDQHLPDADFIVIAIPNMPETVNLIGAKQFELMKPSAFLINVGRAAVVNEEALYQALSTRRIAGAGLDVWYQYPPSLDQKQLPAHFPFHELDNVIMTPHKPTTETMEYRWAEIAENVRRFARGENLKSVVGL